MSLKELDSAIFASLRRDLIPENKGSELQQEFINAAKSNGTFINWISKKVPYDKSGNKELELYPNKLTQGEFKDTPKIVENIAYDTWSEITPRIACRSSFWGAVTLNHIKKGVIDASYLAVDNTSSQTGLGRIEAALSKQSNKLIDDVVRTILRRFSGLPEARGGLRSIYVNCTFGRAWWREKITREAIDVTGGDEEAISRTLRTSQEYWEKLVNLLSTRNSVFGDERIRTSLIWALSDYIDDTKSKSLFRSSGTIDSCMGLLSIFSAYQEFGVYEQNELKEFIKSEVIDPCLVR